MAKDMVNSVFRAAEILNIIKQGQNRVIDIGRALNLSNSTTHRLLKTLENCGFVFRDPISHQYFLGHLILKLASDPVATHQNLVVCVYDEMQQLQKLCGETVAIHMRVGTQRICLEEMQSSQHVRFSIGKGCVSPIYAGSAGKVLLSELSESERDTLLANIHHLASVGPNTITNRNELLAELERIRKQGYAVSAGETLEGSTSISVPVRGYLCPIALSILGPEFRLGPKLLGYEEKIKMSAKRISGRIKRSMTI